MLEPSESVLTVSDKKRDEQSRAIHSFEDLIGIMDAFKDLTKIEREIKRMNEELERLEDRQRSLAELVRSQQGLEDYKSINELKQHISQIRRTLGESNESVMRENKRYSIYVVWTGLVASLVGISVFFTLDSVLQPGVGVLLILASLATLVLFILSIRRK